MRVKWTAAVVLLCIIVGVPMVSAWDMERPWATVQIPESKKHIENNYTNNVARVGLGIEATDYVENFGVYGGRDTLCLNLMATANTRELLRYVEYSSTGFPWYDTDIEGRPFANTGIYGDDVGGWLELGTSFTYRFWGGPGSAEYHGFWICSNGFLAMETFPTNASYPGIPNKVAPNAFIAPFWTDLKIDSSRGGSITWGLVRYWGALYVAVTWNDAVIKSIDKCVTFQVLVELEMDQPSELYRQSWIWITYRKIFDTGDVNPFRIIGIEDQTGTRGNFHIASVANGLTLNYRQSTNTALIRNLKIKLDKFNDQGIVVDIIDDREDWVRGYNVQFVREEHDDEMRFYKALKGPLALLYGALIPYGGFMLSAITITVDIANLLAGEQSPADPLQVVDSWPPESGWRNEDYAVVEAKITDPGGYGIGPATVVDASFGIQVYCAFDDSNSLPHSLRATAELEYFVTNSYYGELVGGPYFISTSVDFNIPTDAGNSFGTSKTLPWTPQYPILEKYSTYMGYVGSQDIDDYYQFNVNLYDTINVEMIPAFQDNVYANFDLYLYNPSQTQVASSTLPAGQTERITGYRAISAGTYYIRVKCESHYGLYQLNVKVVFSGSGGGGGGGGGGGHKK